MHNFKFSYSYFLLPVFFLVLSVSPNISGDRIGLVLITIYVILIPASYYLALSPRNRMTDKGEMKFRIPDFLTLLMIVTAIYLGWTINWQFNLLQALFILLVILLEKKHVIRNDHKRSLITAFYGLVFYAMLYIGLNQYTFHELFSPINYLMALLTVLSIRAILYIQEAHKDILLKELINSSLINLGFIFIIGVVVFIMRGHWQYTLYLIGSLFPPLVILAIAKNKAKRQEASTNSVKHLSWVLTACLLLFFLYYFLDTTQVLQAVLGGY